MEIINASIVEEDDNYFIEIGGQKSIWIPISYDDPKEVKKAFNKLLLRLKDGKFKIQFEGEAENLFSQVAKEYLNQLNRELKEVYDEMDQHGLLT